MTPFVYLPEAAANSELTATAAKSRHLLTVLRLTIGAEITVFDGVGNHYPATLLDCTKQQVRLQTGNKLPPLAADDSEKIIIGQALCATPKMDWAVEKMTELGCAGITPLITEKTRNKPAQRQLDRWQRLIIAACEQCGRAALPTLSPAMALGDWLASLPADGLRVLLSPRADAPLASVLSSPREGAPRAGIFLACGTEAGFSLTEEKQIAASGFYLAHLGPRVLRAETTALAALAIIQSAGETFRKTA